MLWRVYSRPADGGPAGSAVAAAAAATGRCNDAAIEAGAAGRGVLQRSRAHMKAEDEVERRRGVSAR